MPTVGELHCVGSCVIRRHAEAGGLERLRGDEMKLRCSLELVVLIFGLGFSVRATSPQLDSIPVPGTKAFPESITSKSDGTLYVGRLGDGGIVRIKPHTHENAIFVQAGALGSRSILGVFADEASNTLWACSNDLSALGAPAKGSDPGSALKALILGQGMENAASRCLELTHFAMTSL